MANKNKVRAVMGLAEDKQAKTPLELGLECPDSYLSSRSHWLDWSKYNGFVWCEGCKKDYPACLCLDDIDKATDLFLQSVESAKSI